MIAVVDTNVPMTANGHANQASMTCVKECVSRLDALQHSGQIILDTDWQVLREYQANLNSIGQPGAGDRFLRWVLQNFKNSSHCALYTIHPDPERQNNWREFPIDPELARFDPSDRKFAALAAVSGAPVWNAVDLDWWDFREAFQRHGIQIDFLCPEFLTAKE